MIKPLRYRFHYKAHKNKTQTYRMKILQIITLSELGGAQSVVINLSNALSKYHKVIVAAGEGDGKMWPALNKNIEKVHIKHLKRALSPISDFLTLLSFIKLYYRFKPDIIHLHSSKVGILGRLIFPNSKIIYTVHGFDSIRIAYRKFLPLERFLQNHCKAIVGVSKYDETHMIEEKIKHNVSTIHNGIVPPLPIKDDPFKHIVGYTHKVLCIARISLQKNINLFLSIAQLLPQYAFIWIGNQFDFKEEYSSNVFFMGNLSNAGAYNEFADIFMLTSNYEGLPMVIIEAMAMGKPIVASNVGGINEIVVNDENGYTLNNDAKLFAEKIQYILENSDIYNKFSQKSFLRYKRDLTVDKMVDGYLEIYQSK